jgi:hypothetical protein
MKNNIKNHLKNHKEEIGYATLLGVGSLICGCSIKKYMEKFDTFVDIYVGTNSMNEVYLRVDNLVPKICKVLSKSYRDVRLTMDEDVAHDLACELMRQTEYLKSKR